MDANACNYNPNACEDDSTCNFGNLVCENPCDCSIITESVIPDIFNQYSFLSDLVDLNNCTGAIVQLFEFGHYTYISVTDQMGTHLYLDYLGINLYCSNPLKNYCKDIYSLGEPTASWQCNGTYIKQGDSSPNTLKPVNISPLISPNPNKGKFHVGFNISDDLPQVINIYSANGQFIQQAEVKESLINIDISTYGIGLYLLEARYHDYSITQKIIVDQ